MGIHSLCLSFFFLSLLFAVSLCSAAADGTFQVVGTTLCADCSRKASLPLSGLHVAIDCKLKNGEIKTVGSGEVDKKGKFKVLVPAEVVDDGKELKECYAQLHSAAAVPCAAAATKIVLKSKANGVTTFSPTKTLHFSSEFCSSKSFWPPHPWLNHPPLPPHPWFSHPPLPPHPWFKHPPVYTPKPPAPVVEPPPVPVYTPKPKPPVPVYKPKPKPPVPVYTPKPKPPVPVYKPKPKPPVVKPYVPKPPVKKPCPPIIKPHPPVVYHPPVVVKPLPPPVPVYHPPVIPKKPCPPLPKLPPKYFHHPKFGHHPPLPPLIPHHP